MMVFMQPEFLQGRHVSLWLNAINGFANCVPPVGQLLLGTGQGVNSYFVDDSEDVCIPISLVLPNVVEFPIVVAMHHDGAEAM